MGWYLVFNKNAEPSTPQHKLGYLYSLPLFYTSFILTGEVAHVEESHPSGGSLGRAALPTKNSSWQTAGATPDCAYPTLTAV